MTRVEEAIFLIGTGLCMVSAVAVVLRTKQLSLNQSNYYLSYVLLILGHYGLSHFAANYTTTLNLTIIIFGVGSSVWYLLGPFTWFYVRSYTGHKLDIRSYDLWHFIPFILQTINLFPYIFLSTDEKILVIDELLVSESLHHMFPLRALTPDSFHVVLRPVLALGYSVYSFLHLYKVHSVGGVYRRRTLSWPILFVLIQLTMGQFYIAFLVFGFLSGHAIEVVLNSKHMQWVIGLEYTLLGLAVHFYSHVIYSKAPFRIANSKDAVGMMNDKYNFSQMEECDELIKQYNLKNLAYLDPNFGIQQMSRDTGVAISKLNVYFKDFRKQKFNDFKIELRIRHAEYLIERGDATGYKIEAIAQSCGYVSRTTFIDHFKRVTGKNPSVYIKEQENNYELVHTDVHDTH
jgi:AraC-like DNA-binding protein